MALVGTGEEGYFVPPTKGTSPTQVGAGIALCHMTVHLNDYHIAGIFHGGYIYFFAVE